jgi:protease-4
MKNHPILFVLLILGIVLLVIGTVIGMAFMMAGRSEFSFNEKIGVVNIEGVITKSEPFVERLVELRKDKSIKAIIVRIDSPGGGVGPSQEIYREIRKTVGTKKVVASMGSVAASGGYYIAAATDKIVCNPGTLTGSIGVIMSFLEADELMKKIGIDLNVIKSGEFKDAGSFHRKMTEAEKELMQKVILDVQEQFIQAVAEGRKIPVDQIRPIADGRILTGAQAKALGLVDELGNFRDAVDLTKKLAGIKGEPTLIFPRKEKVGFLNFLFGKAATELSKSMQEAFNVKMEYRWNGSARQGQ